MRREKVLLVAVPVLLAIAIVTNWGNIMDIARGRKTLREVISGKRIQVPASPQQAIGEIKDIGPKDAKVKVTAYLIFTNPCHWETVKLLRGLASRLPGKLRVEFVNLGTEEGAKRFAEDSKKGFEKGQPPYPCLAWIAVNGRFEFEERGKKKKVTLSGAIPPDDYRAKLLAKVVRQEIEKAYGKKAL